MSNARNGKIARLPKKLRDVVNGQIRDGWTAAKIIAVLEEHEVTGVTEQNITNWRQGGYQDWLENEQRIADMQRNQEFAVKLVEEVGPGKTHEAASMLAASQLYEVLSQFDTKFLKTLLTEAPENYSALVNSLAKLAKHNLESEKFKEDVRRALREEAAEQGTDKGGLDEKTIERIERRLKLR